MPKESIVRDEDENPTHIRVTSDDKRESTLYEYDNSFVATVIGEHKGKPVEISSHNPDGTTDAYEYDDSFVANVSGCHRGEQKNDDGGPCFLTTACVQFAGLPDDCHELAVLRYFRDRYVSQLDDGTALISQYYATAPAIVHAIDTTSNRSQILADMLSEIRRIVAEIQDGRLHSAVVLYRLMFERLKKDLLHS
jgi:hypothetical protein